MTVIRFFEFAAGLVFGLGLMLSGMTDPGKVLGFLDVAGAWDPSLAFVMCGGIAVGVFAFAAARRRSRAALGGPMLLPTKREVDRRMVLGSVIFGVGWGLVGFCPGPALVALGAGNSKAVLFVLAMVAGILVYELLERMLRLSADESTQ